MPAGSDLHVRYHPACGWSLLGFGVVGTAAGVWALLVGMGFGQILVMGPIFVFLGYRYLAGECFSYEPRTRAITLIGPAGNERLVRIGEEELLVMEGGRIITVYRGKRRKLPPRRVFCRRDDWDAVAAAIPDA
ncbi:hypothetical protein EDD29_3666 [Actinocorallia herbida]|uniref:PH (Pleckstrin Homology) domain-containing protein n=1 Tax=Actinocorallia herbida TaxID=58109 RepID=A0A3N1CXS7_9ACTN|nr:hypothetical protein [Actinocorallia herbida]ROO86103.1 hypothetical protein EDD29_3666 [Actinocorallia herbida]